MMSEVQLDDITANPAAWKARYKRQVKAVHAALVKEPQLDWRIVGDPQGRIKVHVSGETRKAQGEVYCRARQLAALWKDLDFERRVSAWGDLFDGAICDTIVETYHSQSVGRMAVSRLKPPRQREYRLHWCHEDPAAQSYTILSKACEYRNGSSKATEQWTMIYILSLDPHPQYGARCYLRLLTHGEPATINDRLLEQLAGCERFCRDEARWEAAYSEEAMRARDLVIRADSVSGASLE